jgi:hypothetical protein
MNGFEINFTIEEKLPRKGKKPQKEKAINHYQKFVFSFFIPISFASFVPFVANLS